jgi:hypothetical protein
MPMKAGEHQSSQSRGHIVPFPHPDGTTLVHVKTITGKASPIKNKVGLRLGIWRASLQTEMTPGSCL